MYSSILLPVAVLASLVSASPLASAPHEIRAGGPAIKPIPKECALVEWHPSDNSVTAFKTTDDFHQKYNTFTMGFSNDTDIDTAHQQCLEQCYGFGGAGCVSTLFAGNVAYTTYEYTITENVCNFYNESIVAKDLVAVDDGSYTDARAVNIVCPHDA